MLTLAGLWLAWEACNCKAQAHTPLMRTELNLRFLDLEAVLSLVQSDYCQSPGPCSFFLHVRAIDPFASLPIHLTILISWILGMCAVSSSPNALLAAHCLIRLPASNPKTLPQCAHKETLPVLNSYAHRDLICQPSPTAK
jgi:hypothetical protein